MNRKKIIKISSPLLLVALIGGLSFNLANPSAETNKRENTFNYVQHEQKEQQRLLDFKNKTIFTGRLCSQFSLLTGRLDYERGWGCRQC